jgi:hypothetical protein
VGRNIMTVSAGVGGGGLGGVVVGSTFTGGGGAVTLGSGAAAVPGTLPFTGATHLMLMVAISIILLVAGVLFVGLARRAHDGSAPSTS